MPYRKRMKRTYPLCVAGVFGLFLMSQFPTRACLWDSETLAAEVARLPEAVKIMTGNFPRHSKAFYEWRVRTTTGKLAKAAHLVPLYDDLAVAQHKLGDHKAAIATMMAKEKIKPGHYETYSNLGTFYIYTDELPAALSWIDKALAINSNAHFGREKYQKWLVEWSQQEKTAQERKGNFFEADDGFAEYVIEQHLKKEKNRDPLNSPNWVQTRITEATTGLLGMMRFADFDNPLLQEALGDILIYGNFKQNAYHLAAQAYQIGLMKSPADPASKRLTNKLSGAATQAQWPLPEVEANVKKELLKGEQLFQAVAADEALWISQGKDASALFMSKYFK